MPMAITKDKSIWIEKVEDFDAECHSCGEVGRPRYVLHFARLCQHFVALCGLCWKKLGREEKYFRMFR